MRDKYKKNNKKMKKEGFMQGVLILMLSQILIKILGLAYKLYIGNKEGFKDTGNAIYNSGYYIYALLLTLSSVGIPNAVSKLVSEKLAVGDNKGAHRIFKISFITFAIIGLIGTLLLFFGAHYIANVALRIPEAELTLVALSPSIFFVSIICVIRGYFNGREIMSVTGKSQMIEQIFKTVLTILFVEIIAIFSNCNTTIMAAGANLATTFSTFLGLSYLILYYKSRKKELAKEILVTKNYKQERIKTIVKRILFVAIPMSFSAILSSLGRNIDSVTVVRCLENFLSAEEAKIQYGILSGKVDTLTMLPLSFNIAFATALVPAIAAAKAKKDMEPAKKRVSFSILVTILIGLPCTIGMFLFAEPILKLLYPNAPKGELLLQITAFTIIFSALSQTINGALQGLGKVIIPTIALGIGITAKLIINLILVPIPEVGTAGAAIGSVVCNIIAFFIGIIALRKNMKFDISFGKYILKPILATFMMGICSYTIYLQLLNKMSNSISTIISIIVAVIIYILAIIALKVFKKEELIMLPYGDKLYKILEKTGMYKG